MPTPYELSSTLMKLRGQQALAAKQLSTAKSDLAAAQHELLVTEHSRTIIQTVAKSTQDQLRSNITNLGSLAMAAVYTEPITLDLEFREIRGKTEARLTFSNVDGHSIDPMEEGSGGACDIAALALRPAMMQLASTKTRPVVFLDEPAKAVNDPSREMHRRYAEMVKMVSDMLGIQFFIVTMVGELEEVGVKIKLG